MRFTQEFEQVYYIIKDFGYEDNTKMVAEVYNLLRSYHRTLNAPDGFDYYKLIVGAMQGKMSFVNGEPRPAKEEAYRIRDRLINEIDGEGILDIKGMFLIKDKYIDELEEGDPLLYK